MRIPVLERLRCGAPQLDRHSSDDCRSADKGPSSSLPSVCDVSRQVALEMAQNRTRMQSPLSSSLAYREATEPAGMEPTTERHDEGVGKPRTFLSRLFEGVRHRGWWRRITCRRSFAMPAAPGSAAVAGVPASAETQMLLGEVARCSDTEQKAVAGQDGRASAGSAGEAARCSERSTAAPLGPPASRADEHHQSWRTTSTFLPVFLSGFLVDEGGA